MIPFIKGLRFKKLRISIVRTLLTFLLLFSCACSKKRPTSRLDFEQRFHLERFFRELLIEENVIFTLFGDKPISEVLLQYHLEADVLPFELLSKEAIKSIKIKTTHLEEDWEFWEASENKFLSTNFFFVKRSVNPKTDILFLVNIPSTIELLKKHRTYFEHALGTTFDPKKTVESMRDPSSIFWDKIFFKDHFLMGLLFGYGEKSSLAFRSGKEALDTSDSTGYVPAIPNFGYYDSKILAHYQRESKRIAKELKGQDFLDAALKRYTAKKL